uniref:Uncharacterized protein n=1 Tax=Siphoviridae sp. ctVif31 TaxID=2825532 RepID=A0A8S5Q4Q4_9CAUD|nr:MAG TPA: hypothetical protein [Siphoviridae sp. ctVif31]
MIWNEEISFDGFQKKIDKWNGEVPKIQGGNTSTIVDTRDMTAYENAE